MTRCVADIMMTKFPVVDALAGLRYVRNMAVENQFDSLAVMESNKVVGVLTYWDLVRSHPNRIAADAMSDRFMYIDPDMSVWRAKEIFDEQRLQLLLVGNQQKLIGILNKSLVYTEIGKHCDLLTGLYKSDYIYHHATRLINDGSTISLIFFDINNFGRIDKDYGHINGDRILQEIAALLKQHMTEQTYLARFGGDEFLVLTPYPITECCEWAKEILACVMSHQFYQGIPVTISAGIIQNQIQEYSENVSSTLAHLINLASLASTKAKKDQLDFFVVNDINFDFSECN